jgi:hypothetical protein
VVQFLKAKGLATDEEFAPFLEQAGNIANVRWRAVRVRAAALIAQAMKAEEESSEKKKSTQEASVDSDAKRKDAAREDTAQKKSGAASKADEPDTTSQKPKTGEAKEARVESKASKESPAGKPGDSKDTTQTSDSDDNTESPLSNPPVFTLEKAMGGGENKKSESGVAEKRTEGTSTKSEGAATRT